MKTVKERAAADSGKLGRELLRLFAIFCDLFIILSLATFDSRDPWLNHVVSGTVKIRNKAGLFGAYLAGLLYDIFGAASWVLSAYFCLAGARRILGLVSLDWWRWTGFLFLGLCVCLAGAAGDVGDVGIFARGAIPQGAGNVSTHGGGLIGHVLYLWLVSWMGATGTFLVWLFCLLMAFQMVTGISWLSLLIDGSRSLYASCLKNLRNMAERREERRQARQAARRRQTQAAEPLAARASVRSATRDAVALPTQKPFAPDSREPADQDEPAPFAADYSFDDPFGGSSDRRDAGESSAFKSLPDADGSREAAHDADGDDLVAAPQDSPSAFSDPGWQEPVQPSSERPNLVHPALIHPEPDVSDARGAQKHLTMAGKAAGFFKSARHAKDDEEDGPPPWVRDFEEGRIGMPARQEADDARPVSPQPMEEGGDAAASPQDDAHPAGPRTDAQSAFLLPPHDDGCASPEDAPIRFGDRCASQSTPRVTHPQAEAHAGAASVPAKETVGPELDEDLVSILWGREQAAGETENGVAPPLSRQEAPGTEAHAADFRRNGATGDAPLVSALTAVAVEALRDVGTISPDVTLYASSPEYADAALSGLSEMNGSSVAASPITCPVAPLPVAVPDAAAPASPSGDRPAPVAASPASAGQDRNVPEDIRIFEASPVEAAAKTGIVQAVIQRVKRVVPLPPLDLLETDPPSKEVTPRALLEEKGRSLMTCLKDFGIQGELVGITPGPVVTMFEVRPAPGVRVSRIANLSDDLALALKAVAVRIQAPVPGTDTVGIEIPNEARETVCLKKLLGSELFRQSKSLLTLALGRDIAGLPAVADLATMPHLLVAGATGAGKSVGINSIILSLIYKARPDQVKLLLVDPKRVEMAIYADLPHLVHPVVTEMQLAKNALEWAVSEMEQRYNCIARAGVRNIADYNAKVDSWKGTPPEGQEDLVRMPYLVIIIDELADLMLVAAKEVETSIVRLAQLARAAGIHLILATQRPSVDVVTGLIKANFPCRISFQVTSKHDSRTILDTVGAEQLLGRGDMLFKPAGGKFRRMHGAFVSDKNVNAVVDYWRRQLKPEYSIDFSDWASEGTASGVLGGGGGNGDVAADPLYNEAVKFVRQQGKASISLIQRKFRIGFNKAARFVEQMEQDGIIGPADGSKPRMVIR